MTDLFLYPEEECYHPHACIDRVYITWHGCSGVGGLL